jgi:hypothetical protein
MPIELAVQRRNAKKHAKCRNQNVKRLMMAGMLIPSSESIDHAD